MTHACRIEAVRFLVIAPVVALVLATAAHAQAVSPDGREQEAKRLEQQLVAPCCWRQQVAVHDSAIAQEIRKDIRIRLTSGETPAQVRDAYVREYGRAILVEPPAEGLSLALYVLPPVVLLLSGALLVMVVRRFTRPRGSAAVGQPAPEAAGAPAASAYARRLDDDLASLD